MEKFVVVLADVVDETTHELYARRVSDTQMIYDLLAQNPGKAMTATEIAKICDFGRTDYGREIKVVPNYQRAVPALNRLCAMNRVKREEVTIGKREITTEEYIGDKDIDKAVALMESLGLDASELKARKNNNSWKTVTMEVPIVKALYSIR